jgi:hypothetical protein
VFDVIFDVYYDENDNRVYDNGEPHISPVFRFTITPADADDVQTLRLDSGSSNVRVLLGTTANEEYNFFAPYPEALELFCRRCDEFTEIIFQDNGSGRGNLEVHTDTPEFRTMREEMLENGQEQRDAIEIGIGANYFQVDPQNRQVDRETIVTSEFLNVRVVYLSARSAQDINQGGGASSDSSISKQSIVSKRQQEQATSKRSLTREELEAALSSGYEVPKTGPLSKIECAVKGTCDDIDDLVYVLVGFGQVLLKLIGSLAFVMFVVGGFTMILSFGNAERFKQGQQILVAAVTGLLIALSAYILVEFILDGLQFSSYFRG